VEFLSIFRMSSHPCRNAKPSYWKLSGDGSGVMSYNRLIAELSHSVPYHLDLHTLLVTQRSSGCKRLDH